MADKGTVGTRLQDPYGNVPFVAGIPQVGAPFLLWEHRERELATTYDSGVTRLTTMRLLDCDVPMAIEASRADDEGASGAPCLKMTRGSRLRLRVPVAQGARAISVKVKQDTPATPLPKLIVKANPEIGLAADLEATAPAGSGWKTCGPVSFTSIQNGGVWIELAASFIGVGACYWDDITVA